MLLVQAHIASAAIRRLLLFHSPPPQSFSSVTFPMLLTHTPPRMGKTGSRSHPGKRTWLAFQGGFRFSTVELPVKPALLASPRMTTLQKNENNKAMFSLCDKQLYQQPALSAAIQSAPPLSLPEECLSAWEVSVYFRTADTRKQGLISSPSLSPPPPQPFAFAKIALPHSC